MRVLKGWTVRLVRYVSLFLALYSFLFAGETKDLLSGLRQEKLRLEAEKNELESDNLKYDWLNQIVASFSRTNSDRKGMDGTMDTFSVVIDQPIFKSGGIYYAVKYANASREYLRITSRLSEQSEIKSVVSTLLNIKKIDLQILRQNFLIDNAKIDIVRKKEQYDSGFLDSSYLDQAILTKSALQKTLLDMESSKNELLNTFKTISDADYLKVAPPVFGMIDKQKYISSSLLVSEKQKETQRNEYLKKMTIANFLPTLSLVAGYYDTNDIFQENYKTYGLKLSMPIFDVNRGRDIQMQKLDVLKSKVALEDTKRSEENLYENSIKKISFLEQKIDLARQDVELYSSLLVTTTDAFKAGEKTIYDVDTLTNSKQTMALDADIFGVDVQLLLLDLYAKMNGEI
ncbi:MAG: TolC family protein [Sulfurospirillaceae bacterium]|nr:TolC family protein [Sulfurospirillaceae bacterium]